LCCFRYDEAGAAATRIKELRSAEAQRLKGLLAATHQAELAQLQDNFQQVGGASTSASTKRSKFFLH
jgi:hypothetical protein